MKAIDIELLKSRLGIRDISRLSAACQGSHNDRNRQMLFSLINDEDIKISYNALWVFTHFNAREITWLTSKRDQLTDLLLATSHVGKKRLLLTLLERLEITKDDLRTDYLDFCLSGINSCAPYAIRALCLKQAFAQCRFHPELLKELIAEIELMNNGELSPGLVSARRNIIKRIAALDRT